jgi:hypothetical protein
VESPTGLLESEVEEEAEKVAYVRLRQILKQLEKY